ncbi:MAG: hypothetical protein M9957_04655 [Rhodobacteraceae bacterium]|nr:hypothetical protein [Paracoccaceae bacterium]
MQTIENGYRSLSLMYDLGFEPDPSLPVVIIAGLVLASVLATESSLLRVPADYFLADRDDPHPKCAIHGAALRPRRAPRCAKGASDSSRL